MTRERVALIALCVMLCAAVGGFFFGRHFEANAQQAQTAEKTIQNLSGLIDASQHLIQDSQAASRDMRNALALRNAQDQKSTKELRDVLAKTAGSRSGCRFDADSMYLIHAARDRAAAAASGGVLDGLPAATSSGK
ncbi:hypothetical protein [Pandoraea norimbergensis]|nr:hypothetical protein [Pandoraea norimbergensis]